jgi:hypothetical protein
MIMSMNDGVGANTLQLTISISIALGLIDDDLLKRSSIVAKTTNSASLRASLKL